MDETESEQPRLPMGDRLGPLRAPRPVLSLEALHALIEQRPRLRVRASQLRYRIPRVGRLAIRARLEAELVENQARQRAIRDALLHAWGPRNPLGLRIELAPLREPGPPSETVALGERGRAALGDDR